MSNYVILTDSCCDLTQEMADQLGLVVLPLTVETPKGDFKNYLDWREIDAKTFYDNLRAGDMCKTSAVNTGAFQEAMEEILKQGKDVLYLAFSSGLSGTYNASMIAVNELTEAYPERKIYAVDTLCASMGQGLIVYLAAQKKAEGASIDEVRDFVEANKMSVAHWVAVDDLQHLKRGGRISATTAIVGSMLKIKPIIHVNNEGKLDTVEKARGRKAAFASILEKMAATAIDPTNNYLFISHSDCEADAQFLVAKAKERLGFKDAYINYIGPVIGAHTGPGTIAVFWLATER